MKSEKPECLMALPEELELLRRLAAIVLRAGRSQLWNEACDLALAAKRAREVLSADRS